MLADAGANVVVADLKLEDAKKVASKIEQKGGKAMPGSGGRNRRILFRLICRRASSYRI